MVRCGAKSCSGSVFVNHVGLGYLTLDRESGTLSGGEAQRIRLATQIGSKLTGVLYILDEPSIGLHQRDNERLLETLRELRDLGNTVIVVEHDEDTIRAADYLVDMGPHAGIRGGQVVAAGTVAEVLANPKSLTGQFLNGTQSIRVPKSRLPTNNGFVRVINARENNLKNVTVGFPIGLMTCVTGGERLGQKHAGERCALPRLVPPFLSLEGTAGVRTTPSTEST